MKINKISDSSWRVEDGETSIVITYSNNPPFFSPHKNIYGSIVIPSIVIPSEYGIPSEYEAATQDLHPEKTAPTIPDQGKEVMKLTASHQTAVFFDGAALQNNKKYQERSVRFGESLNRPGSSGTIKADIYTVFSTTGSAGIVPGIVTDVPEGKAFDVSELHAIAKDAGYKLVIPVLP